jgi:hypothetical protein
MSKAAADCFHDGLLVWVCGTRILRVFKSEPVPLAYETRVSFLVSLLPDRDNLFDRYVADLVIVVFQMQHTICYFDGLASQAGSRATEHVNPLPNQCLEKIFHK